MVYSASEVKKDICKSYKVPIVFFVIFYLQPFTVRSAHIPTERLKYDVSQVLLQ